MSYATLSRRGLLAGTAAVGLASVPVTAQAAPPSNPYLPTRPHLIEAEQLVEYLRLPECPVTNNTYRPAGQPNVMTWGMPGEPTTWVVSAQCAPFMTGVLKHTYRSWATDDFFRTHFGYSSPWSRDYHRVFEANTTPHFSKITQVTALLPGDIIAINYNQDTTTGHVALVRRVVGSYTSPNPALNFPSETQYAVEIVDCAEGPHGTLGVGDYAAFPDTRTVNGITDNDGAGYGHIMFYASSSSGAFTRYRWSVNSGPTSTYPVAQRSIAAARAG